MNLANFHAFEFIGATSRQDLAKPYPGVARQSLKLNELIYFGASAVERPINERPCNFSQAKPQSLPDQRMITCQRNPLLDFQQGIAAAISRAEGTFSSGSDRAGVLSSGEKAKTPRRSKQNSFTSESNS